MADTYVRPDVGTLEQQDERLAAYTRAVAVMRDRAPDDPRSWARQAALHDERPRGSWFFLPWLRIRLWFFERIVRAVVAETGGPRDWALPYWDCEAQRALPRAFTAPALPGGAPNPLYVPDGERCPDLNAGAALPAAVAGAERALAARAFSPGLGGLADGPPGRSGPSPPGLLEAQPHDTVAAVLGPGAARDPLFPLHLANVDRLWEAWLARGDGRANPAQFDWTDQAFAFCDADRRTRSLTCGQAGDLSNLDYRYEGVPERPGAERVLVLAADADPMPERPGGGPKLATSGGAGVELGAEPRRVALHAAAGAPGPAEAARRAGAARVYLHVEEAHADRGVWEVRVEGGAAVGTIAFPGRASAAQRFLFDITDAVLAAAGGDRNGDGALEVSFHPAVPGRCEAVARVGRLFVTHG